MSIIQDKTDLTTKRYVKDSATTLKPNTKKDKPAQYTPTPEERTCINSILKDFRNGWQTMHLARPEFNDLSLYQRHIVDMLAFNTYQENDGNPAMEDRLGGWKSQAVRPVRRNKAISIAAHETARIIAPKVFAHNEENDEQEDAARVMEYLVDWAREQANYPHMALFRVIASLYSPISWGLSEYVEVYRNVKDGKDKDGKWKYKQVLDEDESGFKHLPIPTDQVYFANFYEREVQKQDFIILRRITSYDKAKAKYTGNPKFQYVQPGIQVVMDDANQTFYKVYDPHMRQDDVEEVIRWRKSEDSREVMVNGVLLSEPSEANPRADHQYPFDAFYYLPINERCIAGKSLVFAMQSDATITDTLYQMIIDGTYLNLFPPTVTSGSDKVGVDVIVPGLNLSFAEKDVVINPIKTATDQSLATAMKTLDKVESSLAESSQDPVQQGQSGQAPSTAYEISRIEQNAATVLGLSMKFIAQHALQYGKLMMSDILQYMTVPQVEKITEDGALIYRTFFAKEPGKTGKTNKIKFDLNMPETMTDEEKMDMSFDLLQQQGGLKADITLWKVNPTLFRDFKYTFAIDSDVLNPRSADLVRAFDLETYDRAIMSPVADQEKVFTDLLMATNPKTAKDPKAFVAKQSPAMAVPGMGQQPQPGAPGQPQQGQQPPQGQQAKPTPSPLGKLPQEPAMTA